MASGARQASYVVQVHRADSIGFTVLSAETYTELFQLIDESSASRIAVPKSEEFKISTPPSSNLVKLSRRVKALLSSKRKKSYEALVLEMLDKEADVDAYDDLCQALYIALDDSSTTKPWCLCIAVSNPSAFQESRILGRRLLPCCDKNSVGLVLLSIADQGIVPMVLCQGNLPKGGDLPALTVVQPGVQEETADERISSEEIAEAFQVLFGHFAIRTGDTAFHVPAVASVRKLSRNTAFIAQLKADISRVVGNGPFTIHPFGISSGGMGELSLALVDGDADRLIGQSRVDDHQGLPLVILCDFLCPLYPIRDVIEEAKARGTRTIAIAAVASFKDRPEFDDIQTITYVDTTYEAFPASDSSCRFCNQGGQAVKGEHFEDYAREVEQFDSFTFWEFISQDQGFYRVGHWASDRTPNHYQFRIMSSPLFRRFSFCLSVRLRNALRSKGILTAFVKKIVCTEGEESTALSIALSETLGLCSEDVIRIPRRFLPSIAGKELGADLQQYVDSQYGSDALRGQAVLIVDQAAHHFKTLSSLRSVCEHYGCSILAFLVFVDRTDTALALGEYLYNVHYIALYKWPVTPRRSHECPCVME